MSSIPLETRFAPLTEMMRRRILPAPGEVLVQVGEHVRGDTIVARSPGEGQLVALDLIGALRISVQAARRCLLVSEGQDVTTGMVLARVRRWGVWPKEVRAPFAGKVQAVIEGRLFLRRESQCLLLPAYVPGQVIEQYPHRGVVIRSVGALVCCLWGSGSAQHGPLAVMVQGPGEVLTWEHVGIRYHGTILVGGILEDPRVLLRANAFGIRGLIVGSMLPALRALCTQLALTVVITEGLGRIPMATPIFDLLRSHHGHAAIVNGSAGRVPGAMRDTAHAPEVIVPLEPHAKAHALVLVRPLAAGMRVRITRMPYLGMIGQVIHLATTPQPTLFGSRVEGAEVRLAGGHRVFVPYANMELIG